MSISTAVTSLRGQDVLIRRSSTAEEDLQIETSCPLNEVTAVLMLMQQFLLIMLESGTVTLYILPFSPSNNLELQNMQQL